MSHLISPICIMNEDHSCTKLSNAAFVTTENSIVWPIAKISRIKLKSFGTIRLINYLIELNKLSKFGS